MGACFDHCVESQWVILNSGSKVGWGDESGLETLSAAFVQCAGKGLGQVRVEMLLSFDMGTHSGTEFNVQTGLEQVSLSLGSAGSEGPDGFLGIQINELTCAHGLGNVVATVSMLLNVSGNLFMDGSTGGTVGVGCADTKLHDVFLLGASCCLLGVGALVALAFVVVAADMASSTSARTSWCLIAAHGSRLFGL